MNDSVVPAGHAPQDDAPGITAREELILGQPPRIAPLRPDELSEDALALTGRLRQIGSGRPPPTSMDEVPEMLGIMLRHAELYGNIVDIGLTLGLRGAIPFREREIAILRTGWRCQAPFEWVEHVAKGKRAGLSDEEIERVTQGPDAPGWSMIDAAIIRAVDELFETAMISDETWATLAETFDDRQMIELPILIGHYQGLAYSQNSLRLRLRDDKRGLRAR